MRTIENLIDGENKFGDTSTLFQLKLHDTMDRVFLDNKPITLNIANASGLVISKPLEQFTGDIITLDFKDPDLTSLTPDFYKLEFEVTQPDGDISKYPTEGGMPFKINQNLKGTSGKLVPTVTFDEVLNAVDEKIENYLATVVKGDKGDTGPVGPMGEVDTSKDYTFTGKETFEKPIDGALSTQEATFTDFNDVAASLQNYQGKWRGGYDSIANSPEQGWFIADIMTWSDDNNLGYIVLHYTDHHAVWFGLAISGAINWSRVSNDAKVVHTTGNETVAGDKTFTGKVTTTQPIKGALAIRLATFTDFATVAQNMVAYGGLWHVDGQQIANAPIGSSNWFQVDVQSGDWEKAGVIKLYDRVNKLLYHVVVADGTMSSWIKFANDDSVVHKTGDENVGGVKSFTGIIKTTSDNSMINGGGNDGSLAMVKILGNSPFMAMGSAAALGGFRVKKSNKNEVSPTDTFTDIFTVRPDGTTLVGDAQVPLVKEADAVRSRGTLTGTVDVLAMAKAGATNSGIWKLSGVTIADTGQTSGIWGTLQINPIGDGSGAELIIIASSGISGGTSQLISYGDSSSSGLTWRKIADDSTVVHKTGTETVAGDKNFTGMNTFSGQTSFWFKQIQWNTGNMRGTWYIQRIGNWINARFEKSQTVTTGTTPNALPVGYRPINPWVLELEVGNAGMNGNGTLYIGTDYSSNTSMTFSYPTNDAWPIA